MNIQRQFSLHYSPETWSFTRKFLAFAGPPFKVSSELITGIAATTTHREKYELFGGIANELFDKVTAESKELVDTGRTSARHGKALAAVMEAMASELYSMLDGLRRTNYCVHRGVPGIQNKSTLTFFQRAAQGGYGDAFPTEMNRRLGEAYDTWFPTLRSLRTETTHGETGSCWFNKEKGTITYIHGSATGGRKDLRFDDAVGYLNDTYLQVVELIEYFFAEFFEALHPVESRYVCGVYNGRMYERLVAPTPALSFDHGRCWSRVWFESEEGYLCPLREQCGAYQRPVPKSERDAYFERIGT